MISHDTAIREKLCQFIKDYADGQYCLELLQFLGRHPCTRFSQMAIVRALQNKRLYTERALSYLVKKGLVKLDTTTSVPLYSLTDDETLHNTVLSLTRIDWRQRQSVLRQAYSSLADYADSIPNS